MSSPTPNFVVAGLPPLTDEQVARIAALLGSYVTTPVDHRSQEVAA